MNTLPFRIYPLSERAVTVEFAREIDLEISQRVRALQKKIIEHAFAGLIEVVPAFSSLTVYYDPVRVLNNDLKGRSPLEKIQQFITGLMAEQLTPDNGQPNVITIPVCYDEEFALDLTHLSSLLGLSPEKIIAQHVQQEYTVLMIGFTPGFPYMGVLPSALESPRRSKPRISVPAGSVAIAGRQTGIYPFSTPGGWQIIGKTPAKMFSLAHQQPSLLKAGDQVRFKSISKTEFREIQSA